MRFFSHHSVALTVFASVLLHLILGWVLMAHSIYIPQALQDEQAMETYLVVEPESKSSSAKPTPELTYSAAKVKPASEPNELINKHTLKKRAEVIDNRNVTTTQEMRAKQDETLDGGNKQTDKIATNSSSKKTHPRSKLDHRKALQQFKQKLLDNPLQIHPLSKPQQSKKRINVPREHQTGKNNQREIIQSTEVFTRYRENGRCYTEVKPDASIIAVEGISKSWRTIPSPCNGDATKKAFDAAMSKWLKVQ